MAKFDTLLLVSVVVLAVFFLVTVALIWLAARRTGTGRPVNDPAASRTDLVPGRDGSAVGGRRRPAGS